MAIVQSRKRNRVATTNYSAPLTAIGTIGGAIAGSMAAPGPGTAAGAETGSMLGAIATGASLGSTGGGLLGMGVDKAYEKKEAKPAVPLPQAPQSSAAQRRLAYLDNGDPTQQLAAAQQSLMFMPKHLQDEYGPTIDEALVRYQRRSPGGVA